MVQLPWFLTNPDPEIYRNGSYLVLDFETTNKDFGSALTSDNRVVLAVWNSRPNSIWQQSSRDAVRYEHKFAGEYDLGELKLAIESVEFIVAHNAKFELQWLQRLGIDIEHILVYDTMLGEKVLLGNRMGGLGLDDCCKRHSIVGKHNLGKSLVHGGVSCDLIPESVLLEYCKQDVKATEELFHSQLGQLEGGLLNVVYTRCLLTPVLADIEHNGLYLDSKRVKELYGRTSVVHSTQTSKLREITGGINLQSRKQLAEFLYDKNGFPELKDSYGRERKTDGGARRTDAATISSLRATTKGQKEFLKIYKEYNETNTALSKYLEKFQECCAKSSALLRANFHQTRTQTHRLSSTGGEYAIQFQNMDRDYKSLFTARRPGWQFGSVDGAQLEFRVASFLGQDRQSFLDIVNDTDVHALTAQVMTDNGQAIDRQTAKTHTFKPLYGGTSGTDAERAYYEAFKARYPGIYKTQMEWVQEVLKNKKLVTPWGLTFYWPDTRATRTGYITNTSSIFNYPVQSLATAEIIPVALVYFWHRLKRSGLQLFIVNTVHDSVEVELPPNEVEAFKDLATQAFTYDVYEYLYNVYAMEFNIPLGVGIKIGTHWNEGIEQKINLTETPFEFNYN